MYKIMALDVGTKRIGVALSDFLHVIAIPHSCIQRQPEKNAIEDIIKIAKENHVEKIVVGVPKNMDDTIGFQAKDCIDFSQKITGFDIILEDERLTSEEAEDEARNRDDPCPGFTAACRHDNRVRGEAGRHALPHQQAHELPSGRDRGREPGPEPRSPARGPETQDARRDCRAGRRQGRRA
jgi:putative Holliday junction resolvase